MPWADSPTIVLGADGFIGAHLVRRCRVAGWPVHAIGRAAGDFTDHNAVEAALCAVPRAGRILHAVTKQRTGPIQYDTQGELLHDNTRIHLNVLEAWRRHQPQAKLISLGSSCTYAEAPYPMPEKEFGIGLPHPSVRGYALAKQVLATGSATYGQQYGMHWLHLVMATVFGPGAHHEDGRAHFMSAMIARAVRSMHGGAESFEVWGNPDTVRDLLHVDDQIDAILAADAAFTDRILNITANAPVTVGGCARAILSALRWDARVVHPPGSFQGAGYKSLNSTCFLQETGWRPRLTLEEGIAHVVRNDFAELACK